MLAVSAVISPPVRVGTLLTAWQSDWPVLIAAGFEAAAVAWYIASVYRLRRRGRRWPLRRIAAFVAGVLVVVIAINSGLAHYDDTNFTAHVFQHLLLMNLAPPLLALGAPVTLALQSSRRRTTTWILKVLHSAPARLLTHPGVAAGMAIVTMYGYFLTPLYRLSLEYPLLHYYMHLHFLIAGCLYWWPLVGADVLPRRWSHGAKLALLFASVPWTSFLGIAILTMSTPIAPQHTLADTHAGGGVLWATSEFFTAAALLIVFADWAKSDLKQAARYDKRVAERGGGARSRPTAAGVGAGGRPMSTWELTKAAIRRPSDPDAGV